MNNFLIPLIIAAHFLDFLPCEEINREDRTVINRIKYIYYLKNVIDEKIWNNFSNNNNVPLIYYSTFNCYITNPSSKFINMFNPKLIFENNTLSIYKTRLLDSVSFHMEVKTSFDDTANYAYKAPFIHCSSPEITKKYINDVNNIEIWSSMILHEYFHGFQFSHPKFRDFFETEVNVSSNTLKEFYTSNKWFKEGVDKENELLLYALNQEDKWEIHRSLRSFFELRTKRRNQIIDSLSIDIEKLENNYETMEGTARYIEYFLYNEFSSRQLNLDYLKDDSLFKAYQYFVDFTIDKEKWLYTTGSNYFYATGLNMARLLDKLHINYKDLLFKKEMFLVDFLKVQID